MQAVKKRLISENSLFGFNLIEQNSSGFTDARAENDIGVLMIANSNPDTDVRRYSCNMSENLLELELPALGRFRIENGNQITITYNSAVSPQDLLPFLYGACMGGLLYQRDIIPLHGSAITTDKGAVLFVGASGCGKSTTAAAMINRGYSCICDDISAIRLHNGKPVLITARSDMKLWKNSLDMLEMSAAGLKPIRRGLEKYFIPGDGYGLQDHYHIHKIYILATHNKQCIDISGPLKGMAKFNEVKKNAYRKKYIEGLGKQQVYFQTIMPLLAATETKTVLRPRLDYLEELIDQLETDMLK